MSTRSWLYPALAIVIASGCTCHSTIHSTAVSPTGALDELPTVVRVQLDKPLYDPSQPVPNLPQPKALVKPPVPFRTSISSPTSIDVAFASPLQPATDYTVTVRGGVLSADRKSELKDDVVATFRTPLNRLERVWSRYSEHLPDETIDLPPHGSNAGQIASLGPKQQLVLRFRYPITQAQANQLVKIYVKDGQPVPVTMKLAKDPGVELLIDPNNGWARDTPLVVNVDKGLGVAGTNVGPLLTDAPQAVDLKTYGPLTVDAVHAASQGGCVPPKVITLNFSNPVACKSFLAAISAPGTESSFKCVSDLASRRMRVEAMPPLPGLQQVSLTVAAGVKDEYGESLTQPKTLSFNTCQQGTEFAYQRPFVILDPGQPAEHVERVRDATALKVEGKRLSLPALWSLLKTQQLADQVAWTELPWWLNEGGNAWEGDEGEGDGDDHRPNHKLPGEISEAAIAELNGAQSVTVPVGTESVPAGKEAPWQNATVGLDQFLGGKRGLVLLRTTPLGESGKAAGPPALRVVNVTDIGLSARISDSQILVLAASYTDGKPLPNTKITVQQEDGKVLGSGETGPDGVLSLPVSQLGLNASLRKAPYLIQAVRDDDESFVWTKFTSEYSWGGNGPTLFGSVYTDRGIYKPGEKGHLHAVVRFGTADGFANPAGQKAKLRIQDPDEGEFLTQEVELSEYGSLSKDLEFPANAKLGTYSMTVSVGESSVYGNFMVGEFRRAEMKVEIHSPDTANVGGKLNATVQGDYFFGAPAAGLDVRWSITRNTTPYHSTRFPDDTFSDPSSAGWWEESSSQPLADGTGTLDDKGAFVLTQPLNLPAPVAQHEQLQLSASVDDANGQSVGAQKTVELFGSKVLLGMEPGDYLAEANKPTSVTVVAVKRDDTIAAHQPVRVVTKQIYWRSLRREGPGGGYYWTSERVDEGEVERCKGKTDENGRFTCSFTPDKGGELQIIAETNDGKNAGKTGRWLWIWGDPNFWGQSSDENKVTILLNKKQVNAGETATVAINSPFHEGYALITVEREDILWHKAMPIGTTATVEIPTLPSWAPDVTVTVTVVRGRLKSGKPDPEHDKPTYAIGHQELKVKPVNAALDVKVAAGQIRVEPGAQQTVTATITRPDGQPAADAEVNLWAVDEGVLSLTAYHTPAILDSMYQHRGYGVLGLDTRQYILGKRVFVEPVKKGDEDGGGGGDQNDGKLRKNFDPLAVWIGSTITNAQGQATTTFTVPDTLTTYRVMAVAVSKDDRFGSGDTQFKVNKTLMLRQALPRFARAGDRFDAGVLVNHLVDKPTEVTVDIESMDDKLFTLTGPKEQKVTVKPNETKAVLFHLAANDADGAAEIRFSAHIPGHQDRVELKLPVNRIQPRETVAASGVVASGNVSNTLTVPAMARPVSLDVNVSGFPISALEPRLREMVGYPYGCLEQKTSKVLPLVAIRELAQRLQMKSIPTDQIKGWVTEYVSIIPNYRCSDGGFDYWPGCHFGSSTYLTAFALEGMLTVKKYGFDVAQSEIDQTVAYLKKQVEAGSLGKDEYEGHGHTAGGMMSPLRVLAEAGSPLPDVEKASFEKRADLPLFAKAELTRSISTHDGPNPKADTTVSTLMTEIGSAARQKDGAITFDADNPKEYWWAWDSEQHNTALVLRALVQVDPADGRIPMLLKGLIDLDRSSEYYVTSDTTQTLLGMVEAIDRVKSLAGDGHATVTVSGQKIADNEALGAMVKSLTVPGSKLGTQIPIDIANNGQTPVFYGAFLTYGYPATARLPAVSHGFAIDREYLIGKDTPAQLTRNGDHDQLTLHVGDFVKVKLKVNINDDGRLVVIEDPLPAGLEVVNTDLATSDKAAAEKMGDSAPNWWDNYHRELRDDRVEWHFQDVYAHSIELTYVARASTAGTFHAPGSHAERMYQPEINGRAEGIDVVVLPKGQ